MSDTESEFLDTDPNKLTIPQLKSKLNQLGVDLPMRTERKQFYVDLFTSKQEEKRKEIEKSKRKREAAEEAKEKTTPKKAKKTDDDDEESSSAKKNRKRRQSNPFQGGVDKDVEEEDDEEKLEAKPRRRLSTSRVSEPVKTETTTVAVVEEIKEVTPSRRSIAATSTVETTTTTTRAATDAPPSPSRQRRYTRNIEATPSTTAVSTTPTRRTRITGTLTQGGTDAVPATSTISSTTITPRRSTASSSATTPYSDWRSNRERRRSQSNIDTSSVMGNIPLTSADDADRFLTKAVTPEKPSVSRIPGPSAVEAAPVKQFDLISYLYTGLMLAWIFFVLALVFIGAFGGKWPFGSVYFCDTGVDPQAINSTCVVCPYNGVCSDGVLVCNPGYVRSGTVCVEDVAFNLQAIEMVDATKAFLAKKRGMHDCQQSDESAEEVEDNIIAMLKARDICDKDDFDYVYQKAKQDFEENGVLTDDGIEFYVRPEDGIKPLSCRIHIFLTEHIFELAVLVFATAILWYIIKCFKTSAEETSLARSFVDKSYEMLQQQKIQMQLAATNGLDLPPYIAVEHIRDALLVPPIDRNKRNRIWGMTTAVVHSDARVQETTVMLHGNQETVWEWIAPVRLPKEVLTPGRSNKQEE